MSEPRRIVMTVTSGRDLRGWLIHDPDGSVLAFLRYDPDMAPMRSVVGPYVLLGMVMEINMYQWGRLVTRVPGLMGLHADA